MAKPDPHEPITEQMLNEATDAILEGVGSMFKDSRGRLDGTYKRFDGMDKRLDKVGRRLDTLEVGQSYSQRPNQRVEGRSIRHAQPPTIQKTERQVDKYHPLT